MRLSEVLTGNMTYDQAVGIFSKLGVDPRNMDPAALKTARKQLIMKHHTDLGGAPGIAQDINSAYDLLSKGTPSGPSMGRQQSRPEPEYRYRRPDPNQQSQQNTQSDEERYPIWAQAGHSGGIRETGRIYRNDYTDMNFIKKSMWELSGQSTKEYTLNGYDGAFFRGMLTVFGSPKIFNIMAQAMIDWQTKGGNPYQCRAVFVNERKSKQLFLIYADGKFYGDNPIPFEHESFNLNPSNDQQFTRRLPEMLDQLANQR